MRTLRFLALAALLAIAFATPRAAQAQFGVAGGLNFTDLGDIGTQGNFENSTGYHVGIFYDKEFGPLAIRPGVFYRRLGEYEFGGMEGGATASANVSSFEVPVDVRFEFFALPLVDPYILGAPVLVIPRGEDDFGDGLSDVALNADIGLGTEVSLPGLRITPLIELRYSFGVTDFVDGGELEDAIGIPADEGERLNTFMLRVGVKF